MAGSDRVNNCCMKWARSMVIRGNGGRMTRTAPQVAGGHRHLKLGNPCRLSRTKVTAAQL